MAAPSVVVIGAGQAGSDTAAALRSQGFGGRITLVGAEGVLPYQRPPLSKQFLAGARSVADLALRPASFHTERDIEFVGRDPAVRLDRNGNRVTLASGRTLGYQHLVLAVGARARRLPVPGARLDGVLTLRTLTDAGRLRDRMRDTGRLLVIGGGFVGLEVAATARAAGLVVTVVESGPRLLARAVSGAMSAHLLAEHRAHGVRVLLSREVTALHGDGAGRVCGAELDGGERIAADLVVVGIGALPDVGLAAEAGLAVGDGILVDGHLRTSDPAVYAIGDCARFPSPHTGRPLRLESVQNASDQARCVAAALCGAPRPYAALPWFWTEQYGLRLQIAGIGTGHDRVVTLGDPSAGRFSLLCFRGNRLLATESVNRPADHMITRRLMGAGAPLPTPREAAAPGFGFKAFQEAAAV
ncbi:NAD(P)/FAD-dependent oxidoreductase [Streptomyces caniferus]|uniref:NAD(P)/FAD-dependent oxidoreductase n=1 Tax=Streptomyces caniferus TaxID=285557 RepID=UPI0038272FC6